jgi:hypothetical protein
MVHPSLEEQLQPPTLRQSSNVQAQVPQPGAYDSRPGGHMQRIIDNSTCDLEAPITGSSAPSHNGQLPLASGNHPPLDEEEDTVSSPNSSIASIGLVEARAVTEESTMNMILQEAQQVDANELAEELELTTIREQKERECRRVGYCIIAVALVALTISLVFGLGMRNPNIVTIAPTVSPSTAPSAVPSSAPTAHLHLLLKDLPNTTQESLQHPSTPQWKAWDWLSNHQNITNLPEWRKKQLFALATFFYTFEGENWNPLIRERWMDDDKNECRWFSLGNGYFMDSGEYIEYPEDSLYRYPSCNSAGEFISLDLQDLRLNGLAPPIPHEISLLSSLNGISLYASSIEAPLNYLLPAELYQMASFLLFLGFGENSLNGLIPSELGLMTSIRYLDFDANNISGPLPTELGRMTNLEFCYFGRNSLTGWIPSELGLLTKLTELSLTLNHFSGLLPSELGRMTSLTTLSLSGNSLTGSLFSEVGGMTNMTVLRLVNLTMLTGSIPSELALLTSLKHLDLHGSGGLSGTIPDVLCYLQNSSCTFYDREVVFYEELIPCTLDFDCSDTLCGCDCPCFNGTGATTVRDEADGLAMPFTTQPST